MGSDVPMPDLSHLTDEERQTIMMVMSRHKEEEKAEIQMYKSGTQVATIIISKYICFMLLKLCLFSYAPFSLTPGSFMLTSTLHVTLTLIHYLDKLR